MSVYFITCRELGFVKIGCAYNPFARLATIQTSFPLELSLEAVFVGAYREEREYHKQFVEHRVRGEWFKLCPEIEALLATTKPPSRPRSVAQKKRLLAMHVDTRWSDKTRESAERQLYAADIHFPFRVKEEV